MTALPGFRRAALVIVFTVTALLPSCIFSPPEGERLPGVVSESKWQEPVTPGIVIQNLKTALNDRDIDLYERCLHPDYYYESPSPIDSLNAESWSRSTDISIMERLFRECTTFVFIPNASSLIKEYGRNIPNIPSGSLISDDHPDQVWYVYVYDISMDMMFSTYGDLKVQQFMKFVMVEDPKDTWSIIRWIDDTAISR